MIGSKLIQRHYLVSVVSIVIFLILGFFAQHLIMRAIEPAHFHPMGHPPMGPPPHIGGPPPPAMNPRMNPAMGFDHGPPFPPPPGPPPLQMILTLVFVQIACVILGAGLSTYLLFRSLKQKAKQADEVLAELQKGNLKARFPVTKMDEIGQAMSRFNKMADEIERVVEHMKQVERSRVNLLQDLTHDLRTPIASLKNLLETLADKQDRIDPAVRAESMALAVNEVEYFARLVEDLLVIAQMSEPKYHLDATNVSLVALLEEEIDITLVNETGDDELLYAGDAHLLKRMFRNAIKNALSFAKSRTVVRISKSESPAAIVVRIEDDGPGFTPRALEGYGTRKFTRALLHSAQGAGRLSVGLGSVILKTVATLHRGTVVASNRISETGKIEGACVEITLPI